MPLNFGNLSRLELAINECRNGLVVRATHGWTF